MRAYPIFFLLSLLSFKTIGQGVQADFSIPSHACLNEKIETINSSTNATQYEWDGCQGDLSLTPVGSMVGPVMGSSVPTGLDVVFDGVNLYGFVTSHDNNSILRVKFGAGLGTIEETVNLGNIGSLLDRPSDIKIVADGGKWYGFVYNSGANILSRIDFGASLANNTPTSTLLDNSSTSTGNQGLDVIKSGSKWYVIYSFNSQVGVLRLNTIESVPSLADKLITPTLTGSPALGDIKLLVQNGLYYAYTTDHSAPKLYRLYFGANLFSLPVEDDDLSSGLSPALLYYGLDGGYDAGKYFLFLVTTPGSLIRVGLGSDLSQDKEGIQNLGDLGGFSGVVKNKLIKLGSTWYTLSVQYSSGNIYRAVFPSPGCQVIPGIQTSQNFQTFFSTPGVKYISLKSSSGGEFDEIHKSITISSVNAPVIDFTNHQVCVDNPIEFSLTSDQALLSQSWNFGDGGSSLLENPEHQYNSIGNYEVRLSVSTGDCNNFVTKSNAVYNSPIANFDNPFVSVVCTNQSYVFENASSFNPNLSPTWQWKVDGSDVSTATDLTRSFLTATTKQIELIASIPGCSSTLTKNFNIQAEGPLVDFSLSGICQQVTTQFTNGTTGTGLTYAWTFGDGNSSTAANPTHTYQDIGDFQVSLTADNASGCQNSKSETVSIKSKPQPNFSLDLPPFSCSGSASQFNDLTPSLIDSNISSWLWSFGDSQNGISTAQNAQYTYVTAGQYNVALTSTTNFGCSATTQKQVTIQQSPQASFTNSAACVNQATSFVDSSSGSIKSRQWNIGGNSYTTPTVSNTFTTPGSYQAQLMVTANNNCISTATKTVIVPVAPSLSFSVENNCSGQNAIFTDTTPVGADPVSTRIWDFANQGVASGSPVQHLFPSIGTYGVKMTVTNQSGCSYPITKTIVITKTPTANFTASPTSGPPPLVVQFTNTSVNATSYLWQFNDATGSASTQLSPSFTFTTLGDYLVKLTATSLQGCKETVSKEINVIHPLPDLSIDQVNVIHNTTTGTIKMSVSIHNKGNSIISGTSLLVDASGGSLIKEHVSNVIRPGETLVYVTTTELVLRADEIKYLCAEVNTTDDQDMSNNKECLLVEDELVYFPAYPNPNNGQLHLDWIAAQNADANVLIVNTFGQKVYTKQIGATREGLNQLEFDVSNLGPGEYILIFEIEGTRKSFRFIII
jgi:PKD repeat protein